MALPARRVPESVAHLDVEMVAAALINHDANIGNAARELDVPSGDLRKLVLVDQHLTDAALEAVELRLDDAEANLSEALHCDDPRRRDAVSMFMLRNTHRAAKRGYAVAASAASLEVGFGDQAAPHKYVIRWANEPDQETEEVERDGKRLVMPRYGSDRADDADADGRRDDCLEGEMTEPSALIDHVPAAAEPGVVESEPDPAPEPVEPVVVESAAVRRERERIDAWIRNRLIDWPPASCLRCRKPIIAGQDWQEVSNGEARARFHLACHIEWRSEQEAAAWQALGLAG
jgi:hypothetical protein